MRIRLSPAFGSCICFVALAIFPTASRAQYKEIDLLGQDLAQACAKPSLEENIIVVADLRDAAGTNGNQGHYFSLLVTSAMNFHRKGELALADTMILTLRLRTSGSSPGHSPPRNQLCPLKAELTPI